MFRIGIFGWTYQGWRGVFYPKGSEQLYVSGYRDTELDWWAARVRLWAKGRQPADAKLVTPHPRRRSKITDVFVYFDNDAKVHAPFDAQRLRERVAHGSE